MLLHILQYLPTPGLPNTLYHLTSPRKGGSSYPQLQALSLPNNIPWKLSQPCQRRAAWHRPVSQLWAQPYSRAQNRHTESNSLWIQLNPSATHMHSLALTSREQIRPVQVYRLTYWSVVRWLHPIITHNAWNIKGTRNNKRKQTDFRFLVFFPWHLTLCPLSKPRW